METRKGEVPSSLTRYWTIVRNGLFMFGLRNRLALIGIDIKPYYNTLVLNSIILDLFLNNNLDYLAM